MNVDHDEEFAEFIATGLDHLADVPTEQLRETLRRHGSCQWVRASGDEPEWTGDDATDQAMAAPICAACPVQATCLEYEFRTEGCATSGVWGPFDADDRRAVFLALVDRRAEQDGGRR